MTSKNSEKKKEIQKRADAKRAGRTRNFATVVYPESAPSDWMDRLDQLHIATLISPLHDKDTNPNGDQKKPHYHVLLMFESPVDFESKVKPIFEEIGAVGRESVNSCRGYARYLCHLDNPEKAQYEPSDVRCMGGANYFSIIDLPTDDIKLLGEIFAYVQENEIYSLAELFSLSQIYHPEWFYMIATSKCYVVDKFIKSLEWERSTGYVRKANRILECDETTGEVLKGQN